VSRMVYEYRLDLLQGETEVTGDIPSRMPLQRDGQAPAGFPF